MKAVSTIIAVILMLIITIGLAGTAYIYISGIMTGRMSKTIEVLDVMCVSNGTNSNITIIVSNKGTDKIKNNELKVYINNDKVNTTENLQNLDPITPRNVTVDTYVNAPYAGKTTILVVSPSNSITSIVWC